MLGIDAPIDSGQRQSDQQDHGLGGPNPSPTDDIVRRGQAAVERKRRALDDWWDIGEALQVGQAAVMRLVHTNQPSGKRYEKAMAEWLVANGFHVIDKCTRSHLLECLRHRDAIDTWRATLTEPERFSFNHPTTVLRKWKAKNAVPNPNAPLRPSAVSKLKDSIAQLEEENYRMRREIDRVGGDLWTADDAAQDIAEVMLVKLSANKAERVARAILQGLKKKKTAPPSTSPTKGKCHTEANHIGVSTSHSDNASSDLIPTKETEL